MVDREDAVLFAVPSTRRRDAPFVVLAGHVDTVPHHGNFPGTRDDDAVVGRGAADMKGALAVMLETASWLAAHPGASDLDVGLLFFGREELPITQSALLPLFDRCDAHPVDRPRDRDGAHRERDRGRLPREPQREGRGPRPDGAHGASVARTQRDPRRDRRARADRGPRRRTTSRSTAWCSARWSASRRSKAASPATSCPDRVEATVNFRYAPTRTPDEAEARLRELLATEDVEIAVIGNAPPAPVAVRNPLVERLRAAGELEVGPEAGVDPRGGVRDDRGGRRQLRTGRPAVRSS